ncbi:MAG: hypothetical protein WCF57_00245, partial [Pyrinomonadaceae bacterium]
ASNKEAAALKLLLDVAAHQEEESAVRGAALRALAGRDAPGTIELACLALAHGDATLIEDAYAALFTLKRTRRAEMREASKMCAPRAAAILNTVTSDE